MKAISLAKSMTARSLKILSRSELRYNNRHKFIKHIYKNVNKIITQERRAVPKMTTLIAKMLDLELCREFSGSNGFLGNGGSDCGADPP